MRPASPLAVSPARTASRLRASANRPDAPCSDASWRLKLQHLLAAGSTAPPYILPHNACLIVPGAPHAAHLAAHRQYFIVAIPFAPFGGCASPANAATRSSSIHPLLVDPSFPFSYRALVTLSPQPCAVASRRHICALISIHTPLFANIPRTIPPRHIRVL